MSQCFFYPVFLFLISISLAACSEGEKISVDAEPVQHIRGLSMFEMSQGSYTWHLKAVYAEVAERKEKILLSRPEITFYKQGKAASVIIARRGEMFTRTKDMKLRDDVVARSLEDGTMLKSPSLNFTSASNKIWCTDEVTLYQDKTVIKGKGFNANPDMSEIVIENQKTVFADED